MRSMNMDGIGQLEDAKAVEREQAVQLDQGKYGRTGELSRGHFK